MAEPLRSAGFLVVFTAAAVVTGVSRGYAWLCRDGSDHAVRTMRSAREV